MSTQRERTMRALNILTKWRTLLTGWQLGTWPKGDPECDAVSHHRELSILLRAEVSALIALLIKKGLITEEQWLAALEREAIQLNQDLAAKFPGVTAHENGLTMDRRVLPWMKGWER